MAGWLRNDKRTCVRFELVWRDESGCSGGEIYNWGGKEKNCDQRANAQESTQWELVLGGDGPAQSTHFAEAAATGAFGEAAFPANGVERQNQAET